MDNLEGWIQNERYIHTRILISQLKLKLFSTLLIQGKLALFS